MPKASKSTVSTSWFIRVDGEIEVLRPKLLLFAQALDVVSMLATHHNGQKRENPHCHIVIQMSESSAIQKASYAIRVKKQFEVVDRGYALDVWDGRKAEYGAGSYLFHEQPATILHSKSWSPDEIKEAQRIAVLTNAAVDEAKQKASVKYVEKAIAHFKDKASAPSKYELFSYMMHEVHEQKMYWPGTFKAKQLVEEVEIKLTTNLQHLTNEYYGNIFR